MTNLTTVYAALAVLAGALAMISIWSPRRLVVKLLAVGATTAILPLTYGGLVDLLSRPKPVGFEWWHAHADHAAVLSSSLYEDEAIYLWLQLEQVDEPRAYRLPWDRDLAEQLQAAQPEAAANETQVQMRTPFEPSLDPREPLFYAIPQPSPPPKAAPSEPPLRYQREPGSEA